MHPTVAPTGIVLDGVAKSYGPVPAVRGIDLTIAAGQTVALLGPNGAGKSTTIDLLLGLARPDRGSVHIFGRTPAQAVAAGRVGAMLQTGSLLRDLSVRELVGLGASLYPDPMPVDDVLSLCGLDGLADRRTQKLSGGESQRVRFALAAVSQGDLLVLDEPTVAMDVEARHTFWATTRAFAADGRTIVFATHYLDEADRYADRIILLARGRVVADGPANQIRALAGSRVIRATLPDVEGAALEALPGVVRVERRGAGVVLTCADSDGALRALLAAHPTAADIEVTGAGLDEAFLDLTADDRPEALEVVT
jgi:ABC-2 type transport system ATP-binding protein